MTRDQLINDFAIRSFRDTGDGDYITARLTFRARLLQQFLWSSLQAIEKYLKCMLVLNRMKAPRGHNLANILQVFDEKKTFDLVLTDGTRQFLDYLDTYGPHRYYEIPYYIRGDELLSLDRAVWEVRRYARVMDYQIKDPQGGNIERLPYEVAANEAAGKQPPHRFSIIGGRLEAIIANPDHPSHKPLLWQNAFFGGRSCKKVRLISGLEAGNSPLSLHPEILAEVKKYAYLPDNIM
jgi:HEPN domain-containing protein